MKKAKLWFSYTLLPYELDEPAYFNAEDFEWSSLLEENYELMKNEAQAFLTQEKLTPYFNTSLVKKKDSWKTSGLLHWGLFAKENYPHFPKTWNVIKQIPGLVSFSVSWLKAGSKIEEHNGDTNAVIRVHLPIYVPSGLPDCSFTVKGETRAWEEGKLLLFNDAQLHKAQNLSSEHRVILILDIMRPEFMSQKTQISARVINGLIWQWMTQVYPNIRKYPMWFKQTMWKTIRFGVRNFLRYQRKFVWK